MHSVTASGGGGTRELRGGEGGTGKVTGEGQGGSERRPLQFLVLFQWAQRILVSGFIRKFSVIFVWPRLPSFRQSLG